MVKTTIGYGTVLIVVGLVGYFGTGQASVTALIPAFLGLLLLILGIAGRWENLHKNVMHIAVAIALLGFLGTVGGLVKLFTLLSGGEVTRPTAIVIQSIMAVMCGSYVGFGVKSFADARRRRETKAN